MIMKEIKSFNFYINKWILAYLFKKFKKKLNTMKNLLKI